MPNFKYHSPFSWLMKRLNLPKEKTFVGPALLWKRIIAFIIDIAILDMIFSFAFGWLISSSSSGNMSFSQTYEMMKSAAGSSELKTVFLIIFLLAFVYFYKLEKRYGQTIGKKLLNIYVVSTKEKFIWWQAFLRNIGLLPLLFLPIILLADPFFMAFSRTGQTLSEILSQTKSVEVFKYEQEVI